MHGIFARFEVSCYSNEEKEFSKFMFPLTEFLWHKTKEKMTSFCVIVEISNRYLQTIRSHATIFLFSRILILEQWSNASHWKFVWCKRKRKRISNWYLTETANSNIFIYWRAFKFARRHSLWMMSTEFPFNTAKRYTRCASQCKLEQPLYEQVWLEKEEIPLK